MTKFFQWCISSLRFRQHYKNPLYIFFKRIFAKNGRLLAIDRVSGIQCRCTVGSYRMFGEVWHDKTYDIPKFPINKGDIVIDIGANQGFYTCYAAHQGALVYAFEPFLSSFETLLRNIEENHFTSQVTAKPWAIAGKNGAVELIYSDKLGGGMNTINTNFSRKTNLNTANKVQVPCYTLPYLLAEFSLKRIRLCKIDCEGSELEILQKLEPSHLALIDAFVVEYHPEAYSMQELLDLIMSWKTHQISFAEDKDYPRQILRLLSNNKIGCYE